MQLQSNSLNRTFEFVTFEKEENGKVVRIILHDSLEDVIHNQVGGVSYSYNIVASNKDHSVVVCSMWDNNGRKVEGIGESIPATLDTEIAKNYPTLIATQRAFDRAAIRYLALPGKVFSNTEISLIDDVTDTVSATSSVKENTTGIVSSVVLDDEDTMNIGDISDVSDTIDVNIDEEMNQLPDVVDTSDDNVIVVDEDATPVDADTLPFDVDGESDELTTVGDYVITMNGKYATAGLSINEIYKKDASWVEWIADNFKARNAVAEKDVAQIKKFVALKRGQ